MPLPLYTIRTRAQATTILANFTKNVTILPSTVAHVPISDARVLLCQALQTNDFV